MSHDPGPPPSNLKDWLHFGGKDSKKTRMPFQWVTWLFNFYQWAKGNMGTNFFFEVSQGHIAGYSSLIKFGRINGTTGNPTDDVIAPFVPTYLTAASTMRIKAGGDAADDAAGTGAQTVQIWGVDANYAEITDILTTAGASASTATTQTYLRVTRAEVILVGSGEANAGAVTIEAVTGGTTQALITAGDGRTLQAITTVPAGKTAYLVGNRFSLTDQPGAGNTQQIGHIKVWARKYNAAPNNNYESWTVVLDTGFDTDGTSNVIEHPMLSEMVEEKSDIKATIRTHVSNAECEARLFIVLKDN